jgi:ribosome-associated toxin RatA of RatAB toxin-antitoxin module
VKRDVEIVALVPDADAAEVFAVLAEFERYPELTSTVREVELGPELDGRVDSTWSVNFRNGILRWTEHDVIDRDALTITFTQIHGDFATFEGRWRVAPSGDDVTVRFEVTFDLGMPTLDPLIGPVAHRALVDSIRSIITGVTGFDTTFAAESERAS